MQKKQKFYVVWQGRNTGVFNTWDECKLQVDGFRGAQYKSFPDEATAWQEFKKGYSFVAKPAAKPIHNSLIPTNNTNETFIPNSLAVDAACSGNPGVMEYRGVHVQTRKVVFSMGPFPEGTNNIGEFLAIAHGLAILQQKNIQIPIYSDSKIAINWIREGKCKTKLARNPHNKDLFDLITRAENWLATHTYTTPIYKWRTEIWGEIPADFGRK